MSHLKKRSKKTKQHPSVKTVVNKVLKENKELKFFDVSSSAFTVGSGATLSLLSGIPQGVAQSQRVGDQVELVSLEITYEVVQANTDIYSNTRVLIFQWFPNTILSVPALASILYNTAAIGPYSQYNWQLRDQYHVIYDKLMSQAGLSTAVASTTNMSILHHRLTNFRKTVKFSPAVTAASNNLFFLFMSDSSIAPFPVGSFAARLLFRDAD
jgi:hypothetical protein